MKYRLLSVLDPAALAPKNLLHHFCLAPAQQPVVDEDARQLVANRLVQQRRRDARVHAARQPADHAAVRADLVADPRDRLLDERDHRPVARGLADPEQPVAEQLGAARRVDDLGVELQAVDPPLGVREAGERAVVGLGGVHEAGRDRIDEIRRSVTITKPRGVGLSRALSNEWSSYSAQLERVSSETFEPAENEIEQYISGVASKSRIPLDDAARLTAAVKELGPYRR